MNGQGKAVFANGDEYVGEFRDGVFSGKGRMVYRNMEEGFYEEAVYEGGFRNMKREGYGEMTWAGGRE